MILTLNNNLMSTNISRMINTTNNQLFKSTERLSSGLRINSAADDPAGMAVRELMRTDMAAMRQGLRSAADGISLIQTAEGAMGIIDEKLVRMKELAEQAATGTYTTVQREIINSEYQAMAAEIDRIANATEFNGVKLLDGSMTAAHKGQGLKIHFGAGNNEAEDYYFVNIPDTRSTTESGLRVGGDAKNDIWGTVPPFTGESYTGCCGGGIPSLNKPVRDPETNEVAWKSGQSFSYGYNWDGKENNDENLSSGRYVGGVYQVGSGATLQELVNSVNKGTQARVRIDFKTDTNLGDMVGISATSVDSAGTVVPNFATSGVNGATSGTLSAAGSALASASMHSICLGDEIYYVGSASLAATSGKTAINLMSGAATASDPIINTMASAINGNADSEFWAMIEDTGGQHGYQSMYVFAKEGGDKHEVLACDTQAGAITASAAGSARFDNQVVWYNDETDAGSSAGTFFGNGGKYWATLNAVPTGYGSWGVEIEGQHTGLDRDVRILNVGSATALDADINIGAGSLLGLTRDYFVESQNASDGAFAGAHVRTQSHAQEALEALTMAIENKETIRAHLGAQQNRLENTISNMETEIENMQTAESRISDVDFASEMTAFTKNQAMMQVAISMLSQANSLPQMALSLLNG